MGELPDELSVAMDEVAETSWLMNLLTGKGDDAKQTEGQASIRIQLKASGNVTHMSMSQQDGSAITTGLALQFRDSLVKLLQ